MKKIILMGAFIFCSVFAYANKSNFYTYIVNNSSSELYISPTSETWWDNKGEQSSDSWSACNKNFASGIRLAPGSSTIICAGTNSYRTIAYLYYQVRNINIGKVASFSMHVPNNSYSLLLTSNDYSTFKANDWDANFAVFHVVNDIGVFSSVNQVGSSFVPKKGSFILQDLEGPITYKVLKDMTDSGKQVVYSKWI